MIKTGKAWFSKGKIHFDADSWALVLVHARKQHRSPKDIVIAGLRRVFKVRRGKSNASV